MKELVVFVLLMFFAPNGIFGRPETGIKKVLTYPSGGARNVHPATGIGITYSEQLSSEIGAGSISVTGAGVPYTGNLKLSANRRTLIFTPSHQFGLGELVTVHIASLHGLSGDLTEPVTLSFTIRKRIAAPDPDVHSDDPVTERALHPETISGLKSVLLDSPYDTLPQIRVLADNNPSDGFMYIANYTWRSIQPLTYGIVLDKHGAVKSVMGNGADYYNDFKPHPDGTYSYFDAVKNKFFISDTNFAVIDSVVAPDGYITDGHELRITSDNNYWFIGIDYIVLDTFVVPQGHNPVVIVTPVIFELDRDKNLIFEWRTIDHYDITDATYEDMEMAEIDFCHVNSITFDADSNIIISCRNMDEITKINKETGDIMWRWGGKNNQFRLEGDTLWFSHQHAVRRTAEGTYTMMDNGDYHLSDSSFSRALEFTLDTNKMIAREIWHFRHTPDVVSGAMGYVQRLSNNGTLIGWGECDSLSITEVDSNNRVQFDMVMPGGTYSYRAYKFDSNYLYQNLAKSGVNTSSNRQGISISSSANPVVAHSTITCSLPSAGYATVSLVDGLGRHVLSMYNGFLTQGSANFDLNTKNIAPGWYSLRLITDTGSANSEVIVIK